MGIENLPWKSLPARTFSNATLRVALKVTKSSVQPLTLGTDSAYTGYQVKKAADMYSRNFFQPRALPYLKRTETQQFALFPNRTNPKKRFGLFLQTTSAVLVLALATRIIMIIAGLPLISIPYLDTYAYRILGALLQ
jgi:hypothetical protein